MDDPREAMQMALDFLDNCDLEDSFNPPTVKCGLQARDALRAALSAVQEPVAWMDRYGACIPNAMHARMLSDGGASERTALLYSTPLYTHPAPAAQPLPDETVRRLRSEYGWANETIRQIEREVLRAHGIGGTNAD